MVPNYNPYFMQNQNMQHYGQNLPTQQSPFVSVRSELEARNYPVAYGNSVTFKDETAPFIYSKTMGFSQLDKPIFEKYRLIKEDISEEEPQKECGCNGLKSQIENLELQLGEMWNEINILKDRRKGKNDEHAANVKSVQTKSNVDAYAKI